MIRNLNLTGILLFVIGFMACNMATAGTWKPKGTTHNITTRP